MCCWLRKHRLTTLILLAVFAELVTSRSFPQTLWFKYRGNPILDVGPPGEWDDASVNIFQVIREGLLYRGWYSGNDGVHRRIGYATSPDGITWTKHPKPVIDLGPDGSWDWRETATGHVLRDGSWYRMWYHGYDGSLLRIGYAESNDGVRWTKPQEAGPVLSQGPSEWDAQSVGFPCVLKDPHGELRMWYSGYAEGVHVQIGLATGTTPRLWKKHPQPVLTTGQAGKWDDHTLLFPNVLFTDGLYEMWYAGSRAMYSTAQTGYATSFDGVRWVKHEGNPVLCPGVDSAWDGMAAHVGDVMRDRGLYHMWYGGFDGRIGRTGYAISPAGAEITVPDVGLYVAPGRDSIRVAVLVPDPRGFTFTAEFESPHKGNRDHVRLYDDGAHGDSVTNDGLFANVWHPKEESHYRVDIGLETSEGRRFVLENASAFTTEGPIRLIDPVFIADANPTAGDTMSLTLSLRNDGRTAVVESVVVTLQATDDWISATPSSRQSYGSIAPGAIAKPSGAFCFLISPLCPAGSDIRLVLNISSHGLIYWSDSFTFTVQPPWWRTTMAYVLYGCCILALIYGARRAEIRRVRQRHRLEMERYQAEQLKEIDRLKSRFFANISHELRTPLSLIRGPVEQLLSGSVSGEAREQYELIRRNSRRLEQLVNQLLDLSRLEAGQMKLRASRTKIDELVQGIVASLESLAAGKGIRCSVNVRQPIVGWIDRDALEKIVVNLVSNAFKFTPKGGEVTVTVGTCEAPHRASAPGGPPGQHLEIRIADTGIGIRANELSRIFERFYQVNDPLTRGQEGSGIGLALTKELVELQRGTISASSESGRGSTFTVVLPIGREHLTPEEIVDDLPDPGTHGPVEAHDSTFEGAEPGNSGDPDLARALIVEDNSDMRKFIRNCLSGMFQVVEATNGSEGIRTAREAIPDLVISDVMMPGMDGFELCSRLKVDERTCHIPVILLTAKAGTEHIVEGLETGADDYVIKPFEPRELQARARNLVEQRQRLREKYSRQMVIKPGDIALMSLDEQFLNRALSVAEAHISDRSFSAEAFAHEMFLSRMQLHRKIKALTGRSPWEFFRVIRLERAAQMLRKHASNVADIGFHIGYDNPSHFAEAFRRHFGATPTEFMTRNPDP